MKIVQLICLPMFSRCFSYTNISKNINLNFHDILSKENTLNAVKSFKSLCPLLKINGKRQAAVLIPLCVVKDEISFLYTLRTRNLNRNSGQVSFPGGMREIDEELQNTAIRESSEELGIARTNIDVWGSGRFIVFKDIAIMPFLGNIGNVEPDKLNINQEEVQYAFAIPLRHFCEPTNCHYTYFRQYNKLMVLPVYTNDYKRIWGMTAYMTWLALRSIIPRLFTQNITSSLHIKN